MVTGCRIGSGVKYGKNQELGEQSEQNSLEEAAGMSLALQSTKCSGFRLLLLGDPKGKVRGPPRPSLTGDQFCLGCLRLPQQLFILPCVCE